MFLRRWILIATAVAAFAHIWQAPAFAQQTPAENSPAQVQPRPAKPEETEIVVKPAETEEDRNGPVPEIRVLNFASSPIAELHKALPELAHLQFAQDQSGLPALLDKIGAVTVDIVRKTPNLISHEAVVSERGMVKTRENFSYLVLPHPSGPQSTAFDEFRIDLASGQKFQEEIDASGADKSLAPSPSTDIPVSFGQFPAAKSAGAPLTQGFATAWLYFYPLNRSESQFRYLGQQKMDGHHTVVVAFAQKPAAVRLPAIYRYQDKLVPMFFQGVAWVDASDFRIVRLRVDLLTPLPKLGLRQLTADIEFGSTRISKLPAPLWLPHEVMVTTNIQRQTLTERHTYSDYRLFRTRSKIVLNP